MRLNAIMSAAVAFFVEVAKMRKALIFTAGLLSGLAAVVGCGSPDRPPPSDSVVVSQQAELGSAPALAACEPRSSRPCTITYVDEDGQLQCPANVQICKADGSEWLACGMYGYDANGDPQSFR